MEGRRTRSKSQNPLSIPEVLKKILNELPVNALKSARLVNNFWKNAARIPMRKKCGEIDRRLTPNFINFYKFLEDIAAGGKSIPFAKFGLTKEIGASTSQVDDIVRFAVGGRKTAMIRKVFGKIGAEMMELSLNYEDDWRSWFDATDLPEGLEFPSLQVLNMKFSLFTGNAKFMSKLKKHSVLVAISNIFKAAPSLNKVTLSSSGSDETPTELFIGALSIQGGSNLKFTCLEITTTAETFTWMQLASLGLRLISLTVHFQLPGATNTENVDLSGFTRFLKTQSKSLENLSIWWTFIEAVEAMLQKPTLEFPKLSKLRVLEIIDDQNLVNYSLSYAGDVPALKHLKIQFPWYNGLISCRMEPSNSVETLRIPPVTYFVFDAASIFPNIKRLEIRADFKIGNSICDSMPNLEELVIDTTGVSCIDNMITGRASTFCNYLDLEARRMMKGWSKKFDDSRLRIGTEAADFSRLQALKTLRLFRKDPEQDLEITELSICLVLLKMQSLRVLDLGYRNSSPEVFLPKRVWKELTKKCDVFWKLTE